MSTTTAVRTAAFPHVNLLPPEIAEETRFRSVRAVLVLAVAGALVGIGAGYVMASGRVSAAQESLAAAQQTQAALKAEEAKYAEVPAVFKQLAVAEGQLTLAMGQEVRYSYLLNDLSLTIPKDVWLTSMSTQQDPTTGEWGTPAIGRVVYEGRAVDYNDVAAWLDVLGKNADYSDPYFSRAGEGDPIGDTEVLDFSVSVGLTEQALSNRYAPKAAQ